MHIRVSDLHAGASADAEHDCVSLKLGAWGHMYMWPSWSPLWHARVVWVLAHEVEYSSFSNPLVRARFDGASLGHLGRRSGVCVRGLLGAPLASGNGASWEPLAGLLGTVRMCCGGPLGATGGLGTLLGGLLGAVWVCFGCLWGDVGSLVVFWGILGAVCGCSGDS